MDKILNLLPLLETVGRAKIVTEKKAPVDSLNKLMADFLLTHDASSPGQFYNNYTYYQTIASLVKLQMTSLKGKATRVIVFFAKRI